MTNDDWQHKELARLDRCWQSLMRSWALRWKAIRLDPRERADAELCIVQAKRCRLKSRAYR
jgi:hypothetical protein